MSDPSPIPWFDVVIILALVALNGVLSMSELAIVSSREARLKDLQGKLNTANSNKEYQLLKDQMADGGCPMIK